ncbi:MAG: amidohydrolase family protein [Lachnospiraceae bacterium]
MDRKNCFILKGDIAYSGSDRELLTYENHYLICMDGRIEGIYSKIPDSFENIPVRDCSGQIIIPGMTDLHLHASQYTFRGLGMDLELLDWLSTYTFPEEAKYKDITYAKKAYEIFTEDLKRSYTTRACVYATLHQAGTLELMEQLEKSGLITYVGKVDMDRNADSALCYLSTQELLRETKEWVQTSKKRFQRTFPMITPRFIPTCTDELMNGLGTLSATYKVPVQSHLSENHAEIAWVNELVPMAESYGQAYDDFHMLGSLEQPAIMAHCVYLGEDERRLLREKGTYIAHCPDSNMNIASGIAPVRAFLNEGLCVAIGTDVAGGATLSMPRAVTLAIQASKMYWRLVDPSMMYLSFAEAFYMATRSGGSYFGKTGAFEQGYDADILVIDDSAIRSLVKYPLSLRVERLMYFFDQARLKDKYVAGRKIEFD